MKPETALLLVPPLEIQQFAARIRARYAPQTFPLFPAHITLTYPFVDFHQHKLAERILREQCLQLSPFDITFNQYGSFPSVLFLEPKDPAPILQLYRYILQSFPEHVAYRGEFGDDLHPHMSIAELKPGVDPESIKLPPLPDLQFTVDRISFYAGIPETEREGPVPFIPLSVIPLGGEFDQSFR